MTTFALISFMATMSVLVNSQTYYIGDPIQVSFLATVFPPPATKITSFYLQTPGTVIQFDPITDIAIDHLNIKAQLTMSAGTADSPTYDMAVVQPSSGTGHIYGTDDTQRSRIVATVSYARRIQVPGSPTNTILTKATAPTQIVVLHAGTPKANLLDPRMWVVELMTPDPYRNLDLACTLDVMKVEAMSAGEYRLSGSWTGWSSAASAYLLVGTKNSNGSLQTFSLAGDTLSKDMALMTLQSISLHLPFSLPFANLSKFGLNIQGSVRGYMWIRLRSFSNSYLLGCEPFDTDRNDIFYFPWQVLTARGAYSTYLPTGDYVVDLLWSDHRTHPDHGSSVVGPVFPTQQRIEIFPHRARDPLPIKITILVDLLPGKYTAINVTSIFDRVYLQWYMFIKNSTHNNTNSTGWEPISQIMSVNLVPGQTKFQQIPVPTRFATKGVVTYGRLYGWSLDCHGGKFLPVFSSRHIINHPQNEHGRQHGYGWNRFWRVFKLLLPFAPAISLLCCWKKIFV